jgi:Hypervirulence associated proteins TUDOR domain
MGMAEASDDEFSKGDRVTWNSHGNTAEGTVERKITADTEASGRTVRASEDEPQYEVRSEKSGRTAVHRPEALHEE